MTHLKQAEEWIEFPITGGIALVDKEDVMKLGTRKWHVRTGYAYRNTTVNMRRFRETMHRLIMDCPPNKEIDHINGNKLDNRKSNLRICDRSQNKANVGLTRQNSSGYRGVHYLKSKSNRLISRWIAKLLYRGKNIYIGSFATAEEAADAWNRHAKKLWGEFAYQNPLP